MKSQTYSQLLHKFRQQCNWYKVLLRLSKDETIALQNSDDQGLQRIANDVNKAQTRIEQLDKQIAQLLNLYGEKDIVKRDPQISSSRKEIENLLTTLLAQNAANVVLVENKLEQLRNELELANIAEKISNGYQKLPSVNSKFLDRIS